MPAARSNERAQVATMYDQPFYARSPMLRKPLTRQNFFQLLAAGGAAISGEVLIKRPSPSLRCFDHPVDVLLVSGQVLPFGHEIDSYHSPRERTPRDCLSSAARCGRGRDLDGAD